MGRSTDTSTVSAAARAAGVGVQTLHYYEKRGLIEPARGSGSAYRLYDSATIARVRAIKRAQGVGFTLDEVAELLQLGARPGRSKRAESMAQQKLAELDERIRDMQVLRSNLAGLVERCLCGGDLGKCDLLADLDHLDESPQAKSNPGA